MARIRFLRDWQDYKIDEEHEIYSSGLVEALVSQKIAEPVYDAITKEYLDRIETKLDTILKILARSSE